MDLEKIKRFADSEFESWKIAKAVTEVKNEIKDAEQGSDVVMSDVFKTLRDPLIEQQKKTDAKQNAVIDQLKANQLALTGGLKDLVESNRDGGLGRVGQHGGSRFLLRRKISPKKCSTDFLIELEIGR